MNTEDTIDIIAIAVIALVVGFIVYEVSQGVEAVSDNGGSGLLAFGAGALAAVLLL
jgi:hypothetical protein